MEIQNYIPCLICITVALAVMFRLMHYARFYGPSYFFWIGVILCVTGLISLIYPLAFLFITDRTIAVCVISGGVLISVISLFYPVTIKHSATTNQKIDGLLPGYSFDEFHDVHIKASPDKVKQTLHVTGVKDIPAARLLMKIRGIADEDADISDRASKSEIGSEAFSTPDFNFFKATPDEYITLMILKSVMITDKHKKTAPPEISSIEQFTSFNEPGYVKVAMNFRFISTGNEKTRLTTETRVHGVTLNDSRTFSRYWRIIYPGSAIIRRVWLNTIKKKAE